MRIVLYLWITSSVFLKLLKHSIKIFAVELDISMQCAAILSCLPFHFYFYFHDFSRSIPLLSCCFLFSSLLSFIFPPFYTLPLLFLAVGVERWKTGDCNFDLFDLFFRVSKVMMACLTNLRLHLSICFCI